jgi:hypothetical protein
MLKDYVTKDTRTSASYSFQVMVVILDWDELKEGVHCPPHPVNLQYL